MCHIVNRILLISVLFEILEISSVNYLKSIGSYPNTQLLNLNKELFTGQFISSIILSHIDIENQINLFTKQSKLSSISCEFHPNTFKYLFNIIEQLTTTSLLQSNHTVIHILNIYNIDGISKSLIEKFLIDALDSIGKNNISQEILAELVYMYRTIMSINSSWQIIATNFVMNSIKLYLNLKSIELNDLHEMNKLLASLCILGEYIEPYRLGSIVTVDNDKKSNDEISLALIIEIDSNISNTETPYLIQYLQTYQTENISIDKLKLEIDVSPPNLSNVDDSILDILGYFIQIDTSTSQSLMLLQLKRRSISVLYHILNDKKLIEIFMEKSYASTIAKLCLFNSLEKIQQESIDFDLFNKQDLEKYSLTFDICENLRTITENENENENITHNSISTNDQHDSLYTIWTNDEFNYDQLIMNTLLIPISKYNPWKPYVSEIEMDFFKQGRIGKDEISIVPQPSHIASSLAIQECGIKHRFHGRIAPDSSNTRVSFPTFIIDNLQLSEGKWYYCIRLPVGGIIQIGWATNGFTPSGGCGVGDEKYSWSYDGLRGVFFHEEGYYGQFNDIRWKENDVCGCGIEINGKNTKIKYWLNGKFLGTAFSHDSYIPLSTKKCNLLPHGPITTYFPAITIQCGSDSVKYCELIVSPEDMQDCPLPNGYKPLLLPKQIHTENSLVDYPFNAYLIGENSEDYLYTTRINSSNIFLRDFINEQHIETTFTFDDNHYLILSEQSIGFPMIINNDNITSLTISFDFQILSSNENSDILLFKFNSTEITWKKTDEKLRCVIIFLAKKGHIKVYINNKYRIFTDAFQRETIRKLNLHILPDINAKIKNLAIWKYALSEENIRRLFTYDLSYIAIEYRQLKEYHKQINQISFLKNQTIFINEYLIPFNEPFKDDIWKKKKIQADDYESKYFKTNNNIDYSIIELYGNQTYLVLDKSNEQWFEYTLILNISIPQLPIINEKLTLIILNSKTEIYITHYGKLCLESNRTKYESNSTVMLNEYFNLFICVQEKSVQIYLNESLEINIEIDDERFYIKSNRIDLFKETNLNKNTTNEDTVRISLKSITYLNRAIPVDYENLQTLIAPPFLIIGSNLIAMGYKKSWIESVIKQYKTTNISIIHKILYEQKEQFIKNDLENERNRYLKILSQLNPSIDSHILKDLIECSDFNTNEQIIDILQRIFPYWIFLQSSKISNNKIEFELNLDTEWFSQYFQDLNMNSNINEWILDKASIKNNENKIYQLLDLNEFQQKQTTRRMTLKSIEHFNKNISSKQFLTSRINCEHELTIIYARHTILNMIELWLNDQTTLFPLEKLGDYTFLVTLLKLLDYIETNKDEKNDRIHLLINSILKIEMKKLSENNFTINNDLLESKAPLFYHLQKYLFIQSIQLLFKPSLFNQNWNGKIRINEQQLDFNFILKILDFFIELIIDKTLIKQNQIDLIMSLLFPTQLINFMFNLFLLVPTHQSKIVIIRQLTTLLQTNEYFNLNNEMQQFFFQLLIELSSTTTSPTNCSTKNLRMILTDLVFVLLTKQKNQPIENNNQIQEIESKLPVEIQDLYTTTNVIIAWTDPTKQTLLPETFFQQSNDILGSNFKLNQDYFNKSNNYFNTTADQDLINLMNNDQSLNDSFSKFIQNLPTESQSNAIFYKNSISLSNIPSDCIQIRVQFFYILNKFIEKSLSLVDLSLPLGQSFLTDQIRIIKPYLLSSTKFQLLTETLEKTEAEYNSDWNIVNFDTIKASTNTDNSENTMFYQAYQQLHTNAHITFRRANEQLWHAQYIGMHSTDHGGPYRDSITRICSDICSSRLSLFILCSNGRTNSGSNRDCWIPNVFPPNKSISNKYKKQYRFIGQLFGMAIRKKHYLNVKFPILLWKKLLNESITIEDIEAIDLQSFTFINETEKNIEQIKLIDTENDIDSLFSSIMNELRFDVVSSSGETYELIPGGSNIPITAQNFKHYCSCYRQYRLNEFNRQIDFIQQGLYSIIPSYYLSLFTAKELEETVCGKDRIDIEFLKRNTSYGGHFNQNSPPIERFWTVLSEMFNDDQKKLFLIFVWGRSTLPIRDEDFQSKFIINSYDVYDGQVDQALPRSHTCFFTIDLPAYSTTDIMYERLNYAITCCSSIDGDGTVNDAFNGEGFGSDDSNDDE
ncbi:unnamed protein product [Rotaria sordida]|uniref:Uncharacterized protein n=1 Tax=Rotaria sordida TaxID=392033 RepID=A0A813NRU9_9BILA|nr:unnamed protein product [Rotaria sordida]